MLTDLFDLSQEGSLSVSPVQRSQLAICQRDEQSVHSYQTEWTCHRGERVLVLEQERQEYGRHSRVQGTGIVPS